MRLDIITIFPEYFAPLNVSLIGKAVQRGDIAVAVHDLRTWTHDLHRTVDDTPFGGGPGMVMKPEPWGEALDAVLGSRRRGRGGAPAPPADRADARRRAVQPGDRGRAGDGEHLVFACGRYEGIDDRVARVRARSHARARAVDRRLRARRRRAGRAGHDRGDLPAAARRARQRRIGARRLVRRGRRPDARTGRGTRLHQAADLARAGGSRDAAVRRSRRDRALAPGPGAAAARPGTGPIWPPGCRSRR